MSPTSSLMRPLYPKNWTIIHCLQCFYCCYCIIHSCIFKTLRPLLICMSRFVFCRLCCTFYSSTWKYARLSLHSCTMMMKNLNWNLNLNLWENSIIYSCSKWRINIVIEYISIKQNACYYIINNNYIINICYVILCYAMLCWRAVLHRP